MMHVKPNSSNYLPIYSSILIALIVIINGCDVNHGLDEKTYAKIYMPQAKTVPAEHTVIVGIDTVQAIDYGATYGGPGSPKSDISVTFSVEPALVDTFNTRQGGSYTLLPENAYELEETSAIIPAGEKYTPELKLKINGNTKLEKEEYLLPITMKVSNGETPANKDLQTTYFLIKTNKVLPLNTDIIVTGMMVNPHGADSPEEGTKKYDYTLRGGMEYIQLMAMHDIDFSKTPYSVVVGRHYGDLLKGWASGQTTSFKFNLTEGEAKQGTFFYVGGAGRRIDGYWSEGPSTDISGANWIRYLQTNIGDDEAVAGDDFGWSTSGLMTNSSSATGFAVFEGTNVTSTSVPVDAVFYGSEVDGALNGSNGYRIPKKSDLYTVIDEETGDSQPLFGQGSNIFMLKDAKDGNFRPLGGEFTKKAILKPRSFHDFIDTEQDTKIDKIESGPKVTKFKK